MRVRFSPMLQRRHIAAFVVLALVGCKRKPEATALTQDDGKGKTHECKLVAGGRITQDTTVQTGCLVTVGEAYTITAGATLRIEAGARLAFKRGARILVEDGALVVTGRRTEPAVFTSAEQKPAAGDWGGLVFSSSKPSSLEGVIVEYAGEVPKLGAPTDPKAAKAAALAEAAEFGIIGLLASSSHIGTLTPLADRRPALYLAPQAKLTLVDATVRHAAKVGLAADGAAPFDRFELAHFEDNGGFAMDVKASALGSVTSISGPEPVRVRGSVKTTQSWPKVEGGIVVASLEVVAEPKAPPVVLTLAPETIVRVEPKTSLRFGGYADGGAVVAKKVVFTSAASKPAPGDWAGIHFQKRAPGTSIDGCIIEYAGYEDPPVSPAGTKPKTKAKEEKPRPKPSALVIQEWMKDFQVVHTTFRHNAGPGMGKPYSYFGLSSGTGGCEGLDAPKNDNKSVGQPLCEYHEDPFAGVFDVAGSDSVFGGAMMGNEIGVGGLGATGSGIGGGGAGAGIGLGGLGGGGGGSLKGPTGKSAP